MNKEVYIWIGIFLVVLAVGLYIRFYYSNQIDLKASFSSQAYPSIYPYQKLALDAYINNTGSSDIDDIGVEELMNGNVINVYGVTVPPGKFATIPINFTPTAGGTYNMTIVVDPNKLYNIADRQEATTSVKLVVNQPEGPDAYTLLPPGNVISHGDANLDTVGFLYYTYMGNGYNIAQFNITGMPGLNDFLSPLVDVVGAYINNFSVADAAYANGNTVYSIWMRGYLLPDITLVGAEGRNLTTQNYTIGGNQVTLVHLIDNESLCSWYSDGWIKTVSTNGINTCLNYVQNNYSAFAPQTIPNVKVPALSSDIIVANDTFAKAGSVSTGYTVLPNNRSIVYSGVTTNSAVSPSCIGVITTQNGISYCSSYVFASNELIGATSVIATTADIGGLNETALSVVNTTRVLSQIPINIYLLGLNNLTGKSIQFVNGIKPSCGITGFGCENATFNNGTLSFRLLNPNLAAVHLDDLGCVLYGVPPPAVLNETLPGLGEINVSTKCYNDGQVAQSLPYGLIFNLRLNYTTASTGNVIHNVNGSVYVLG